MPYETLIEALLEEGRTKSDAVLRNAQAEADRLLAEAEQAIGALDCEVEDQIHRGIAAQRTTILSRAVLAARQISLQARHEILDAVVSDAKKNALTLTGDARINVLRALLDELLAAASAPPVWAFIDDREDACLANLLSLKGIPVKEQRHDALLLGISLEVDGQVMTNSLATRLAKAKPELILKLNRLLFHEPP
jgi:V/A-type H+-transporting ATPase subunit E